MSTQNGGSFVRINLEGVIAPGIVSQQPRSVGKFNSSTELHIICARIVMDVYLIAEARVLWYSLDPSLSSRSLCAGWLPVYTRKHVVGENIDCRTASNQFHSYTYLWEQATLDTPHVRII